jgi:quinol monooxygenase YgiN
MKPTSTILMAILLLGCSSEDPDAATTSGAAPTKEDFTHMLECKADDLQGGTIHGPGYDAEQGGLIGETQESYVVHTTQIFVRPEGEEEFFDLVSKIITQLAETPGLVGYAFGNDETCGDNRTLGVWESEEAIYAFVGSGAHAEAMPRASDLSYTGRTTHWTATADEVNALDWQVADVKVREATPLY